MDRYIRKALFELTQKSKQVLQQVASIMTILLYERVRKEIYNPSQLVYLSDLILKTTPYCIRDALARIISTVSPDRKF